MMAWINDGSFPPNRAYLSKALTLEAIAKDLEIVVKQCVESQVEDKAELGKVIQLYANATNGYIGVYIYDLDEMDQVGDSSYLLELPALYEAANAHKDGSFYYDEITKRSAMLFGQSEYGMATKKDFELHFVDELDDRIKI